MKTEKEIQDQIDEANGNQGKFSGMSYEDGVDAALRWVIGQAETAPMED